MIWTSSWSIAFFGELASRTSHIMTVIMEHLMIECRQLHFKSAVLPILAANAFNSDNYMLLPAALRPAKPSATTIALMCHFAWQMALAKQHAYFCCFLDSYSQQMSWFNVETGNLEALQSPEAILLSVDFMHRADWYTMTLTLGWALFAITLLA